LLSRGANSNAQTQVTLYSKKVTCKWGCQEIQEQELNELLVKKSTFTDDNHAALEQIDQDLATILVQTDQQCTKFHTTPWSPTLHEAYLEHKYWSLQVTSLKTKQNLDNIL